jgi:hypothetical protein
MGEKEEEKYQNVKVPGKKLRVRWCGIKKLYYLKGNACYEPSNPTPKHKRVVNFEK